MISIFSLISYASVVLCMPTFRPASICYNSETSCSSEELSSSCDRISFNVVPSNPIACNKGDLNNVVYPSNFISLLSCPTKKRRCTPYLEFTRIVDFLLVIPSAHKLFPLLEKHDLRSLERIASRSNCGQNYDAFNSFFYFADSYLGLQTRNFSYDFILFFLTRFYYFLNLVHVENLAVFNGIDIIFIADKKCVNFLDIPAFYNNATFGTESNSCDIFNAIITDTTITKIVLDFIVVLTAQISKAIAKCNPDFVIANPVLKRFTTYEAYAYILLRYLGATADLTSINLTQKIDFITPQKQFAFIVLPYLSTASATTKSYNIFDVNVPAHFVDSNTARFV